MERPVDLIKAELENVNESIKELESYIRQYERGLADYRERLFIALEKQEEFEKAIDVLEKLDN